MTEKRFTINDEHLIDNEYEFEPIYIETFTEAKKISILANKLADKNEQLKQQLQKYDDWCNSVKRENIDKVLKMSVFEIVELFEYYDEKIEDYEKVLNGDME